MSLVVFLNLIEDKRLNMSSWPLENLQRELEGISLAVKHLQEKEMRFVGEFRYFNTPITSFNN